MAEQGRQTTALPQGGNTRMPLDDGLKTLLQDMVLMGLTCAEMLETAVDALMTQDATLVNKVLTMDDVVDEYEERIEDAAVRLLSLQQPVLASDLRFVSMVLKAVTDMERIGDHCVNIAKVGRRMSKDRVIYQPLMDVQRFKKLVAVMLQDTLYALARHDVDRACQVIAADDEVDVLYQDIQRQLRQQMLTGEPGVISRGSHLLFVAHYLERIGDHCVGIAQRLLFAKTGQRVVLTMDEWNLPSRIPEADE